MRRLSLSPRSPAQRGRARRASCARSARCGVITSPTRPIAWLSLDIMLIAPRSCSTSSAAIVSPRMRLSANATSSGMFLSRWWQTISMSRCSSSVLTVYGPRRVGRARQHVRLAAHLDDVGRVAAAGALGVVGVNRPALERRDRVVDVARLVQRVGVDRDLDVVRVGDRRGSSRSPPASMPQSSCSFRPIAPAANLLVEPFGPRRVALAEEAEVHRQRVGRLQHQLDVPRAGRAGRRVGAGRRAGAAADERRDAARERLVRPAAGR